jgi:ADP-ribose pyrophosphatase YjhB (NUDIX family)
VNARTPGVGCGAAIVRDGRLLLVKRKRPPEAGCWSLPGGKVDFGERVEDAIVREIAEEVGVEIVLLRSLGVVQTIGLDDQHWVSPIHLAEIVSGEPDNREPSKHDAIVWAALDQPPAPLALAAREAIAALAVGGEGCR